MFPKYFILYLRVGTLYIKKLDFPHIQKLFFQLHLQLISQIIPSGGYACFRLQQKVNIFQKASVRKILDMFSITCSDTSGMTIYLTPNLREHNLAYFNTGPKDLVIPPNQESYIKEGICSGKCTNESLDNSIFITSSHLHMHYLGEYTKVY